MKPKTHSIINRLCLVAALFTTGHLVTRAQQQSADGSASLSPAPSTASGAVETPAGATSARTADQYRIGPRDVISIRVVSAGRFIPELSMDSVEVNECGRIPVPSVQYEEQNDMQAAGLTRTELAEQLRTIYKKYKKTPQVIVMVREYNSQPVAINGAVVRPGQFQLRRQVRLLELVQFFAGGPTERAGGSIQIARTSNPNACQAGAATDADAVQFLVFNLNATLKGDEQSNPFLQPGDVITLPEAREAYVIGNVLHPGPVLLREEGITVSRAIAMAGGTMPDTKKDKIRIVRQEPGSQTKREIFVDLRAIDKHQAEDVALLPNDIVEVQTAGGKRLLRSLVGTVVPTVGQLPVQIIR